MKKTLIALAALAATGAFAQSTVSIYGAIDAAYTNYATEGVSVSGLGNSQLGSSKLGFSGTEDLGNGLKANFKLEGGLANDSGNGKASNTNNQVSGRGLVPNTSFTTATTTPSGNPTALSAGGTQGLVFQRYAYVGLSGGFGEVRLGRDYTGTFLGVIAATDPFGTNGPADSSAMTLNLAAVAKQQTAASASNMIGYTTPSFGGVSANVQTFFGENASVAIVNGAGATASNPNDGDGYSATVTYAAGPVFVAAGQSVTKGTVQAITNAMAATNGDYTQRALAASYDMGVAKLAYTYTREELIKSATATATNSSNLIGVTVPVGAFNYKASYVRSVQNDGKAATTSENTGTLVGVGVDYALSKRTTAYSTYSRITNDNVAAAGTAVYGAALSQTAVNPTSTGLAIGIKHNF